MDIELITYCAECNGRISEKDDVFCKDCIEEKEIRIRDLEEEVERLTNEIEELKKRWGIK